MYKNPDEQKKHKFPDPTFRCATRKLEFWPKDQVKVGLFQNSINHKIGSFTN